VSSLLLFDPATPALHEVAEPARLRALVRRLRASRVQDTPVLVTDERHGLLVLDGVHRTKALLSLGVPRMVAVKVPRDQVEDPASWTHVLRRAGGTEEVLAALRSARGLALRPAGEAGGLPVVARVVTGQESWAACAPEADGASLARAYHAVADTYHDQPYERVAVPEEPQDAELQVRWVAPTLAEVEHLVAAHGALPAGITRFALPSVSTRVRVGFEDLARATTPKAEKQLLASLDRHGD
jgi:hypothetical protein